MEMTMALITYCLLMLVPLNLIMLLGMINERRKIRAALRGLWRLYGRKR